VVVGLLFGGIAAIGPVIYGAFAETPTAGTSSPTGTRGGLMLASLGTLFASFGLMADIGQLVSYGAGTTLEKDLVYIALAVGAAAIGTYAVRSVEVMVSPPAANAQGLVAGSMIAPARRFSGTL